LLHYTHATVYNIRRHSHGQVTIYIREQITVTDSKLQLRTEAKNKSNTEEYNFINVNSRENKKMLIKYKKSMQTPMLFARDLTMTSFTAENRSVDRR